VRAAAQRPDTPWRPTGTVLVTGGPEGFAGHVARWLAANGATGVLLAVRGEADAHALDALRAELTDLETEFTAVVHDPADPSALTGAVDALPDGRPLTAVIHTGDDAAPAEDADALLAAVRRDLDALDTAVGDRNLDAFVVFGSISGIWGVSGQGAGAAAGAYLDAVTQERRAGGGTAVVVSWGAWAGAAPDGLAAH
ncbi:KR domain-containing protein, partial [Streptomyces sp. PU_AKi4]|uniref:KR domain-containing protein n=1 Tax=Streptomyces sp. PU_AKi4 TaxID=2800809 RepID=UPI003525119A